MLGAGLLAQKAVNLGLTVKPYIKTSLSPGSGVVTYYLRESGVIPHLEVNTISTFGNIQCTTLCNLYEKDDILRIW